MKKRKKLSCFERQRIYRLHIAGLGIREISRRVNRNHSTISRELSRNKPSKRQILLMDANKRALYAQKQAENRKKNKKPRSRLKNDLIRSFVELELLFKRSPRHISLDLPKAYRAQSISHEAIYQWIYKDRKDLIKYLTFGKKRRQKRANTRKSRAVAAAPKTSISKRPEIVITRDRFGDWEGDTIVSRQSTDCLFTLTERRSRFTFIHKLSNCTSESAYNALLTSFYQIPPELRKTLTLDNGPENACHNRLSLRLLLDVYFCDPYASWQRGTVENANGFIRRFFPKKTNFANVTNEEVRNVQDWLNTRRMDCLKGETPWEVFSKEIKLFPNPLNTAFPDMEPIVQNLIIAA